MKWKPWARSGALMLLAMAPALLWLYPTLYEPREKSGVDFFSYVIAGHRLNAGDDRLYQSGVMMVDGAKVSPPPFLYHPIVAAWHAWVLGRGGNYTAALLAARLLGIAVFGAGFWIAAGHWGASASIRALALGAIFLTPAMRLGLVVGNIAPVLSGLALLGIVALERGKPTLAGGLWAVATIVKPVFGLAWLCVLAFWRPASPENQRAKGEFLIVWALAGAALFVSPQIDASQPLLFDYLDHLKLLTSKAWTFYFHDVSVASAMLPWIQALSLVYYKNFWIGDQLYLRRPHPAPELARGLTVLTFAIALGLIFWRRRVLAERPTLLLLMALCLGFLLQPLSWSHNLGIMALGPFALAGSRLSSDSLAPKALGRRKVVAAALLIMAAMISPVDFLLDTGLVMRLPFYAAWNLARALAMVDTLALMGLFGLMLFPLDEDHARLPVAESN